MVSASLVDAEYGVDDDLISDIVGSIIYLIVQPVSNDKSSK